MSHPADENNTAASQNLLRRRLAEMMDKERPVLALQLALISIGAYLVGTYISGYFHGASATLGAIWCAITGIAVLQSTRQATWREGGRQLVGTFIGVVLGGTYLYFFHFNPLAMALIVALTVLVNEFIGMSDTTKLAATSVVMIMVVSYGNPDLDPLLNSALRFTEACLGAAVAMTVSFIPRRADPQN